MKKTMIVVAGVSAVVAACFVSAESFARGNGNPNPQPVVFVESQQLYYDSIVTADPLPPNGPFQELYMGPNGLTTQYGPGDPGYVGGRWWMDSNNNGAMDDGDRYFLCPLLGPGREEP